MPEHLTVATAGEPDLLATSESEEMYLITLARAIESGRSEPIPMPVVASALDVSVASANEMVRKLAARHLVIYEPYRGVGLTEAGRAVADRVLRTRRLWATFLADHLGFSPTEADEQACQLEHATATAAVDRLAVFLGDPETDPLGSPIPGRDQSHPPGVQATTLSEMMVGSDAEVVAIRTPVAARGFLVGEGIEVGSTLTMLAGGEAGVLVNARNPVTLTRELADTIDVRVIGSGDAR